MELIWAGDRGAVNQQKCFYITACNDIDRLEICAVDNYQVFFDGQFVSYEPERTAAGYSRKKDFALQRRVLDFYRRIAAAENVDGTVRILA